jgi:hypothetical protein
MLELLDAWPKMPMVVRLAWMMAGSEAAITLVL